MARGFDTTTILSKATTQKMLDSAYAFVGRYYSNSANSWKVLTKADAEAISSVKMNIYAIYQNAHNKSTCFSTTIGTTQAEEAYLYAKDTIGQPYNTPIYFCVDYDATSSDIDGCIKDFFTAVKNKFTALGGKYYVGVYGSKSVCRAIKDTNHLATYSMLAGVSGWGSGSTYNTWDIQQGDTVTVNGITIDENNSASTGPGTWRL